MLVEKELLNIYDNMNDIVFGGILPRPEFTVYYGSKIKLNWSVCLRGGKTYHITVSHLRLSDDINVTYLNMLHQMIHIHNSLNGIVDTCKSERYHTRKFRDTALRFGILFDSVPSKDFGYLPCSIRVELLECFYKKITNFNMQLIDALNKDRKNNGLHKDVQVSNGKPITWICPGCGKTLYASKGCRVICGFCFTNFIPKALFKKERIF